MGSDLCIGIASRNEGLEIALHERGRPGAAATFAATELGLATLKVFLAGAGNPVRLAVSGAAALTIALALGNSPRCEICIVSPAIADHAVALAQYAGRSI